MIKELVNFTQSLSEDIKNSAVRPKEGLHIMLGFVIEDDTLKMAENPLAFEFYSKKMEEESDFIKRCKFLSHNGWCIDTNKCFDLPTKAIHSCSPFLVAFKREHLFGGGKYKENEEKSKKQITERFGSYFDKAFELFDNEEEKQKYTVFKNFFVSKSFQEIINKIDFEFSQSRQLLDTEIELLTQNYKEEKDKIRKEEFKSKLKELEKNLLNVKKPEDAEYIIFYLNETLEKFSYPHSKYLAGKLFNTDKYNTSPDADGLIYGTSNFMNSYNSNMPFLSHHTAAYNISGRISNVEAKCLNELTQILGGKILPSPLPIFVFKNELQEKSIGLYKEYGFRIGYREIIEALIKNYKNEIGNYYLLNWVNSADGIIFRDFDFISKFEYEYSTSVIDLFGVEYKPQLTTIFDFQNELLPIIFNNNLIVKTKDSGVIQKYFEEIDPNYCKSSLNHILILKYRKAIYDFVYKSRRNAISQSMFNDIMSVSILEDIRLDTVKNDKHSEYFSIRKKLNIWFSLYEKFNIHFKPNEKTMASKLKDYQEFVSNLINENADFSIATDEKFMYAAGQIINYLISKSKAADTSYQLLEPYTQKSNCKEFQKAIANDFARYKHANYSSNFEKVASFVLTYETSQNLKNYLPDLLAGLFSKNQLFAIKKTEPTI